MLWFIDNGKFLDVWPAFADVVDTLSNDVDIVTVVFTAWLLVIAPAVPGWIYLPFEPLPFFYIKLLWIC